MSDFSELKNCVNNCLVSKNEDDPDVIDTLLVMDRDQTDPLITYPTFAWKTKHGCFWQTFGPFGFGLSGAVFAQARWPKAYKAWLERHSMGGTAVAHPVP